MELSDIEAYNGVFSLHLRKSLEDGCHPIYTVSARSGDQDGHEKCTGAHSSSFHVYSIIHSLTIFFIVYHGHLDRSIWTQGNRPIQRQHECRRRSCHPLPSLGPLRRLLSRRATAAAARGYGHLLFIHHGPSRNHCRVELLFRTE